MIIVKVQGGLGNQLFQYCTARALSLYLSTELKLDLSFFDNPKYKKVYRLDRFNINGAKATETDLLIASKIKQKNIFVTILNRTGLFPNYYSNRGYIDESTVLKAFHLNKNKVGDLYLEGWFSSQEYFNNYRTVILNDLNLTSYNQKVDRNIFSRIISGNSIAVHIRRKDYLTNSYFKTLPVKYYLNSIERVKAVIDKPEYFFFSDDITWVKEQFSFLENSFFMEANSIADSEWSTHGDIEDLMLMSSCKHQIIANSTFSWWGAWLNDNPVKNIYYPANWYNNVLAQKKFKNSNYIPSNWIKIEF